VAEAYQITHALSLYFQLVNRCEERARALRERMFGLIRHEDRRSVELVLEINQRSRLLESQTVLEQSIQAGESQHTETLRRLLALTVNGIAFGMKSTG
jgi:phosphoenolpyruvate carboxylase